MAKFQHDTNQRFDGPWILGETQLQALDDIFTDIVEQLADLRSKNIIAAVERRRTLYATTETAELERLLVAYEHKQSTEYRQPRKIVTLSLPDNIRAHFGSISEAANAPEVINAHCLGVQIRTDSADGDVSIKTGSDDLWLQAYRDHDVSQQALRTLRGWIQMNQPSMWLHAWQRFGMFGWALLLMYLIMSYSYYTSVPTKEIHKELREQAREVLKRGVAEANRDQALTLLLMDQFELSNVYRPRTLPKWYWPLCGLAVGFCIALSLVPARCIAIGRGRRAYTFWRTWIRIVGIVIPGALGTALLSIIMGRLFFGP